MIHELPLERRVLHGHFSRDLRPIVSIDAGDSILFSAPNSRWCNEPDQVMFDDLSRELDGGHALVGPVEVRGARAGETLAVSIDEVVPGPWGVTTAHGETVRWQLDPVARTAASDGVRVRLEPFLGVLGMPPPEPGVHPTRPPRRFGGNIDCKELVAGAELFLPIPVDGALFSAGDGHGRQGDGEVAGWAIECPLARARLTLDVRRDLALELPVARTETAWIAFGFDEDLDGAMDAALAGMLALMEREHGLAGPTALACASVAVDFRVTQAVNGVKGVHAVLDHGALGR